MIAPVGNPAEWTLDLTACNKINNALATTKAVSHHPLGITFQQVHQQLLSGQQDRQSSKDESKPVVITSKLKLSESLAHAV